jgi:hypothetical protein
MGNDELLADQDDDKVPQSLRLLESCLKSIGIDFKISNNDSDVIDAECIETDGILDDLIDEDDVEVYDDSDDEDMYDKE